MSRWHIIRHAKPNGTMTATAQPTARETREWIWNQLSPLRTGANLTTCRQTINAIGNPLCYITEFVVSGHRFTITLADTIPLDVKILLNESYGVETKYIQAERFMEPPC